MEKYGFVYIWYDRKHKRFYIGSHWGTENDGYICSSTWMKQAYKSRTHDFKRRIISRVYSSKSDLLDEEYKWLSLISEEEIQNNKYYNRVNKKFGHWTTGDNVSDIGLKISKSNKGKIPPNKGKTLEEYHGEVKAKEIKEKQSSVKKGKSLINDGSFKAGRASWNKGLTRIYITNGVENKCLYGENVIIPEGWNRGITKKKYTPSNAFRKGNKPKNTFPSGNVPWNLNKKGKWVNNGIEEKIIYVDNYTIPEDWVCGRLKTNK